MILWVLFLSLGAGTIFAATAITFTAKGTVVDATNNQPMPGVSVTIKGTTKGVITDADGEFSIDVKSGDTLVFTYVGYKTVEALTGNTMLIRMSPK
jgi:hypothetical protein